MKTNKKGISLIVLVITIIVIIILAAAIILSMNSNNPIANAKEAVKSSDAAEIQDAYTVWIGAVMADVKNSVVISGTFADTATISKCMVGSTDKTSDLPTNVSGATVSSFGLGDSVTSVTIEDNVVKGYTKNGTAVTID